VRVSWLFHGAQAELHVSLEMLSGDRGEVTFADGDQQRSSPVKWAPITEHHTGQVDSGLASQGAWLRLVPGIATSGVVWIY